MHPVITIVSLALAVSLAGCTALPSPDGRAAVAAGVDTHGRDPGDAAALAGLRAGLSGEVLDRDTAIRIALLNNPGLQEEYARLGFAAADVYEAARPRNPSLTLSVMDSDERGAADQVGVGISQHITDLLMLRARGPASRRASTSACDRRSLRAPLKSPPMRSRRGSRWQRLSR
jgi:hypothetical protein